MGTALGAFFSRNGDVNYMTEPWLQVLPSDVSRGSHSSPVSIDIPLNTTTKQRRPAQSPFRGGRRGAPVQNFNLN